MSRVVPIRRRNARVPLRVGDIWVRIGPGTPLQIVALRPRPTSQKPHAQAVTLGDGTTITEATLRYAFQRKQEYDAAWPVLKAKWDAHWNQYYGVTAQIIPFPKKAKT